LSFAQRKTRCGGLWWFVLHKCVVRPVVRPVGPNKYFAIKQKRLSFRYALKLNFISSYLQFVRAK
jgi:hypothetical protein